ncbi:MAG: PaaI family thioesterase [Caulobacterales bacterium]
MSDPAPTRPPAHMTGWEIMQAVARGDIPGAPIAKVMNMTGFELRAQGHVIFAGAPTRDHYNPIGTVHGGWAATLLDSCMGCAVHTTLPAGKAYTTLTLEIKYVKAMTEKTGEVFAEGKVIQAGSRQATVEGFLRGPDGVLYAHGTSTCMIFGA